MAVNAPESRRERNSRSLSRNGEAEETYSSPILAPNDGRPSRRASLQSSDEGIGLLQEQQPQNDESRLQGGEPSGFQYEGDEGEKSKSLLYLFLLTLSIGG